MCCLANALFKRACRASLAFAWFCVSVVEAQGPVCSARLQAPDAAAGDRFGSALSLADDLLVVGSDLADGGRGSAYLFRRDEGEWTTPTKLQGRRAPDAQFGYAVAVSGSYVVVGAPFETELEGAAYVYRCAGSSCVEERRLTALDAVSFDQFGFSVAIDGTAAVVGIPGADAAEIYRRRTGGWILEDRITPLNPPPGGGFGFSVSVRGDTLAVGAPYDDAAGNQAGAVHVFQRAGDGSWVESHKLLAPDAGAGDLLGFSVALGDDVLVAGAPERSGGSAYVFTESGNGWSGNRLPVSGDGFGISVAIDADSDRLVVGARYDDERGVDAGAGHVFERGGSVWNPVMKLADERLRPGDESGLGATIAGDVAVLGAYRADASGAVDSGAAYGFCLGSEPADADLELVQTGPASAAVGDPITYRLEVTNLGPATATGVELDNPTPPGLTLVDISSPCDGGWPCTLPDLAPGESAEVEVTFQTPSTCPASPVVNQAEVSAVSPDPDPSNNMTTASTEVSGCVDLSISIAADLSDFCSDHDLTYAITVANNSDVSTEAEVEIRFAPATAASWTCTGSPGTECSPIGFGDIVETVSLPGGSSLVYTASVTVNLEFADDLDLVAEVAPTSGVESTPGDNVDLHSFVIDCQPAPGPQFQVNSYTTFSQQAPAVATDAEGNFVVVWNSYMTPPGSTVKAQIRGQRFNSAGVRLDPEFEVSTPDSFASTPAVAADAEGNFVIVWNQCETTDFPCFRKHIRGRRFNADGVPTGSEFLINSGTATGFLGGRPSLDVAAAGNFVVVWRSGSYYSYLLGRRFDSTGLELGQEFEVNSSTQTHDRPSVAVHDDGFVVVWQSASGWITAMGDPIIRGRKFDSGGQPITGEFLVGSDASAIEEDPKIAASPNGEFVVVWSHCEALGGDGSCSVSDIRAQRFDSDGMKQGGGLRVNFHTIGDQDLASVAVEPDGDFLITWHGEGPSESEGIHGQQYRADGSRIGREFQVNSFVTGTQGYPRVSIGARDHFVVAWQSDGSDFTDSSSNSIQARRFSSPYAEMPRDGDTVLYLHQRRFKVEVEWRDFRSETGPGRVVPYGSDDSGLFWFFDAENWEMLVKVLDGCSINGRFWVFAGPTTNVEFVLRVTDTWTGEVKSYLNPLGTTAAIVDTDAFSACTSDSQPVALSPLKPVSPPPVFEDRELSGGDEGCSSNDTRLCLNRGRFQVEIDWATADGNFGPGRVVAGRTHDSGMFWFFNADNWEVLVKVLDGCAVNGHFWVLAAGTTDIQLWLRIIDTETGARRDYTSNLGTALQPIIDSRAFSGCPEAATEGTGSIDPSRLWGPQ